MWYLSWHREYQTKPAMISYIRPTIQTSQLLWIWQHRKELALVSIKRLEQLFNGIVYLAERERHVLYQILCNLNWSNRVILVPDYTCSSLAEAIRRSGNYAVTYPITSPFNIDKHSLLNFLSQKPDAVIASHVYGQPMPIKEIVLEYFGSDLKRPILISDLAHAHSITLADPRVNGYDILLYSLAFYKPMAFTNLGVGIVRDSLTLHYHKNWLNNSITTSVFELIAFCIKSHILKSVILAWLYRIRGANTTRPLWPAPKFKISTLNVAFLSQVINAPLVDYSWQFFRYDEGLKKIRGIEPLPLNRHLTTYYPVIVAARNRDSLRMFCVNNGVFLGGVFSEIITGSESPNMYSNWLGARILNLPVGPHVTFNEIDYTLDLIGRYFSSPTHQADIEHYE